MKPEKITHKRQSVTIYTKRRDRKGKVVFEYVLHWQAGGKECQKSFSSSEGARAEAKAICEQLAGGTGHNMTLTPEELTETATAIRLLRRHGAPRLLAVVSEWCEAMDTLGGVASLQDAAKLCAKTMRHGRREPIRVAEAVRLWVEAKRSEGLSPFYVNDAKNRLERFARAFRCDLGDIDAPEILAWLSKEGLTGRNGNNMRRTISALFSFARVRGYLDADTKHAAERLPRMKEKPGRTEFYKPGEVRAILANTPKKMLAAVAIGIFSGIRTTELCRLEWQDVRADRGFIDLPNTKAKTAQRRLIPILPTLAAWLATIPAAEGRVVPQKNLHAFVDAVREILMQADVVPQMNGFRHSYASYRLAEVNDAPKVALEMGTSVQRIFKNYREVVAPEDARHFFGILPEGDTAEKVVRFVKTAS